METVNSVGIIGGSGFYSLPDVEMQEQAFLATPYGEVKGLTKGKLEDLPIVFLPRHGAGHKVPPHKINYRANLWALKELGVSHVISVNAVGGIAANGPPGAIVLPDQIIDYTYGREHSFADELSNEINHVDFTWPYCQAMRSRLESLAKDLQLSAVLQSGGVYGCMQGPRLESAAEIQRLKNDGCTLVGMTAMPEASLARELGLQYAALCPVVNWAAGLSDAEITMEDIQRVLDNVMPVVRQLIIAFCAFHASAKQ